MPLSINPALARIALLGAAAASALWPGAPAAAEPTSVRDIVRVNARALVTAGEVPGVGVAVLKAGEPPLFFAFGDGVVGVGGAPSTPFRADMLFDIASNTKVFTTNLFGQRVATGALDLDQPLLDFSAQIGALPPKTRRITLKDLGAFTAGLRTTAPLCAPSPTTGCMPSYRPTIGEYGPADIAAYFQSIAPMDFSKTPAVAAQRLPAPYVYSNFSVGMLGLLMGGAADQPLSDANVDGWYAAVKDEILRPLAMRNTFLYVPEGAAGRRIAGYSQATATASVVGGAIAGVSVADPGAAYAAPPAVVISGGGGSGATAVAAIKDRTVSSIAVTSGGEGYVAPAQVTFSGGGGTVAAQADAVVARGQLIGLRVRATGSGYQSAPTLTISGGRGPDGRDATATAHIANGAVVYVSLGDPGAGYVEPLSVSIAPGGTFSNAVAAWAPAGGLKSSLRDMAKFAAAAMGTPLAPAPAELLEGFRIAQKPFACQGTTNPPQLATCPPGATRSALAWAVSPRDPANGVPPVVSKIGGLPGYSSTIALMPKVGLGVVVFINSHSPIEQEAGSIVYRTAENILHALQVERCFRAGACDWTQ